MNHVRLGLYSLSLSLTWEDILVLAIFIWARLYCNLLLLLSFSFKLSPLNFRQSPSSRSQQAASVFIRLPCHIRCSQCLLKNLTYGYTQYCTSHTHKHTYRILTFSPSVAWYVHAVFCMLELPPFPHSSCTWSYLTKWQQMWHNNCFALWREGEG